ncbi:MAG: hypothetical protein D3910_11855 [Candidatus Electrothrix sp. ATG2]|nr:hypothetical protein [Candidatus Electrothrix sp. ATG2]
MNQEKPVPRWKITIKKTRFGEIVKGIKMGAAYAFNEQAYNHNDVFSGRTTLSDSALHASY